LVELYIFANKYNISRIQNVATDEIISLFHDQFAFPRATTIGKIYELTPQGAPIRRLVTDMIVLSHENVDALIDGQARFGDGLHSDFIQDLVKRLFRAANHTEGYHIQRLTRQQWGQVNRCLYHVSEVGARVNGKKVGVHS
jgi:TolB-like protein